MAKKKISKKKSKLSENEKIAPKGVPPAQMASAETDKVGKDETKENVEND